jgi:DNA-binding LytR/AlgR family response regulator
MQKILLVEDDALIAESTKAIIESLNNYSIQDIAYNFSSFETLVAKTHYSFAIVDINLEEQKSGFDVAQILNAKNIPFLFLTSYSDQETIAAAASYSPAGYIVKPIQKESLFASLELLRIKYLKNDQFIVNNGKQEVTLKASQIYFIKSSGNYCEAHTIGGTQLLRSTLAQWTNACTDLVQVHKSYVVNTNMIFKKTSREITFRNGISIPFSPVFRDNLA